MTCICQVMLVELGFLKQNMEKGSLDNFYIDKESFLVYQIQDFNKFIRFF